MMRKILEMRNITMSELIPLILGSAAVGALTSSIITLIGQSIERQSRKRELLISKSIDLAVLQVNLYKDAAVSNGQKVDLMPYIFYARWYHKELENLHSKSKLSSALETQYKVEMGDVSFTPLEKNK
jgi:hypothetical protein